jgi:hypothetical protein
VSWPAGREPDLTNAQRLVEEIKSESNPVDHEIRRHLYLAALEAGHVRREHLTRFAGEQHRITRSDLRSIALLENRFGARPSGSFFQAVLGGETAALAALGAFAAAVGMDDEPARILVPSFKRVADRKRGLETASFGTRPGLGGPVTSPGRQ